MTAPAIAAVDRCEALAWEGVHTVLHTSRGATKVSIAQIEAMAWLLDTIAADNPEFTQDQVEEA